MFYSVSISVEWHSLVAITVHKLAFVQIIVKNQIFSLKTWILKTFEVLKITFDLHHTFDFWSKHKFENMSKHGFLTRILTFCFKQFLFLLHSFCMKKKQLSVGKYYLHMTNFIFLLVKIFLWLNKKPIG